MDDLLESPGDKKSSRFTSWVGFEDKQDGYIYFFRTTSLDQGRIVAREKGTLLHRQEHIEITALKFGGMEVAEQYAWVHDWLDEIARTAININKHRQYRHHENAGFSPTMKWR